MTASPLFISHFLASQSARQPVAKAPFFNQNKSLRKKDYFAVLKFSDENGRKWNPALSFGVVMKNEFPSRVGVTFTFPQPQS
jgi:hypothetical protein